VRSFVSATSIGLLFWALTLAPFVHVHLGGHDGEATIHGHLRLDPDTVRPEASDPSIERAEHEGHHVDVFSSVPSKSIPLIVCLEAAADLVPWVVVQFHNGSDDPDWKRGPPSKRSSPRAPPHSSCTV